MSFSQGGCHTFASLNPPDCGDADFVVDKYESFSYAHLGIGFVSLNRKTLLAVCTPGGAWCRIRETNEEFLKCTALESFIIQVFQSLDKNKNCVRDAIKIASRTQFLFLFKALEDMNRIPKPCTLRNSLICFKNPAPCAPPRRTNCKECFVFKRHKQS